MGPAGVGKTYHARAYAKDVPFCELGPAHNLERALAQLHACLKRDVSERLEDALAAHALVVIDGPERVLEVIAAPLAGWARHTRLLVASRERLRLQDEAVLVVEPLSLPPDEHAKDALSYGAVRFLRSAARSAGVDVEAIEARELIAIARAVDGIPLALNLAASRLRALGPAALLAQLAQPLRALTRGARDAAPHHLSLERAVAVSWNTLDPRGQEQLAHLAALEGPFTPEAAAHVLALEASDSLEALEALTEKSLLQPSMGAFRMLSPIRAFAELRAQEAGLVDRAVAHRQAQALFWQGHFEASLQRIQKADEVADPEQRAQHDALRCSVLRRLGRFERARAAGERALLRLKGQDAGRVLGALATISLEEGDLEAARQGFEEVRQNAGEDQRTTALSTGMIGHVDQELGRLEEAAQAYERATKIFERLPDERLAAIYEGYRATVAHERGDGDAGARYEAAIARVAPHARHFSAYFNACLGAWYAAQNAPEAPVAFERARREMEGCGDAALVRSIAVHRTWLHPDAPLTALNEGPTSDDVRFALRLVRARRAASARALQLGDRWVELGGERIDLSRRRVLWRVLVALAEGRERAPDQAVSRDALLRAGWGQERILQKAAAHRLRVAIHELRRNGLGPVIESAEAGYRLKCDVVRSQTLN